MVRRGILSIISLVSIIGVFLLHTNTVYAETTVNTKTVSGVLVEYAEDDTYSFSLGQDTNYNAQRFSLEGKIDSVSKKDSFNSYGIDVTEDDDNITIKTDFIGLPESLIKDRWEVVEDSEKNIDTIKLDSKIKNGAYVVQTSRDGKIWVTDKSETDYFKSEAKISDSIYRTNNVQLTSGCYYRIIVAYEVRRQLKSSNILFIEKKNYEYKRITETYSFYAYNQNVDNAEILNTKASNVYAIGGIDELRRCGKSEGYTDLSLLDEDDPHKGWEIGKFYLNGYTARTKSEDGTTVVLKKVGDRVSLWFDLEQDLNACNNNPKIEVVSDDEATDNQFNDVSIIDFGRGMLFIRKKDYKGNITTYPYNNFLEASATVGSNTRLDVFEEGDYEVALDYALKYSNTTVFGANVLPKTLHYRVSFCFAVRNADCKLFIRDAKTNEFINNANVAENGFYIDLAKQRYLNLLVTREVMSDSLDGLVPDTKLNSAVNENDIFTDEGVYTIKATNRYTNAETEKKIYVGDSDVLRAYMVTGLSISEINEKLEAGAYIDETGNIVDPKKQQIIVDEINSEETESEIEEEIEVNDVVEIDTAETDAESEAESIVVESSNYSSTYIIIFICAMLLVSGLYLWKKKNTTPKDSDTVADSKNDEEEQ